jgi:pyruvate/2-oxoglutarate dehydrogenase complex dihydrolipoamide acyltransferase (E2) component
MLEVVDFHGIKSIIGVMKSQIEVRFPEEIEKGAVSFWYVKEGDTVEAGKPLVEFITEKTSFTFESPVTGKVVGLLVGESDEVINGQPVAEVETP